MVLDLVHAATRQATGIGADPSLRPALLRVVADTNAYALPERYGDLISRIKQTQGSSPVELKSEFVIDPDREHVDLTLQGKPVANKYRA